MRDNIANTHSALLKYVEQDPLLKGLENQRPESCVNLLKCRAIISGNTELFPGVPTRCFFVTLDVAAIAFQAIRSRPNSMGQVRSRRVPQGGHAGNWRNKTMKRARQPVSQETHENTSRGCVTRPESQPTRAASVKANSESIITSVPAAVSPAPSPLSELEQWVSAERLLEIVWDEQSRPSLQWIRKETKRRMLPHLRRGRLIFYRPSSVLEWFRQRESRPNSMR